MAHYVYINISAHHFKVWGFDCFCGNDSTGQVITYWGRIGICMQRLCKKEKSFERYSQADYYCHKKIEEKLCKGYVGFPNWLYFQMIESPRGIAALIEKVSNMAGGQDYWQNPKKQIG